MGKTLGIICTINPFGEKVKERLNGTDTHEATANYDNIIVANPRDEGYSPDMTHYLVHLSEIKLSEMKRLCSDPSKTVIAFSGRANRRNLFKTKYPHIQVYDNGAEAWEACEREAPRNNPY